MDALKISETFRQSLRQAKKVVVFTGAGVSAESGIPTFRDAMNGLESVPGRGSRNPSGFSC